MMIVLDFPTRLSSYTYSKILSILFRFSDKRPAYKVQTFRRKLTASAVQIYMTEDAIYTVLMRDYTDTITLNTRRQLRRSCL